MNFRLDLVPLVLHRLHRDSRRSLWLRLSNNKMGLSYSLQLLLDAFLVLSKVALALTPLVETRKQCCGMAEA